MVAFAGGSGVVYGYGVRCRTADQISVGVGVIPGISAVVCCASCEAGEQATAIVRTVRTVMISVTNVLNIFGHLLAVIFWLSCRPVLDNKILPAIIVLTVIL